ncbi:gliding motility-associated C-terminal domain-containing protein [uncultured Algibacter sp.]|uniref:gliding motility-associated C-terminal domain-containing protein n=1 Tax=uncultured Algibacter sp. TaxID=298659 RepID=UPI00262C61BA|nr:gliding motility-associated C-terminal domain-containing protein [uncultured Algibacter sp.]
MKTKPTRRNALSYAFFYVLLFGMTYSGFSQCPTVTNPSPPPICDASGYTFNDLNAFATDLGSGIVWYDMLTGGSPFNPNELVQEGVYYADDNSGTCGVRASVTIDFTIDSSSRILDRVYCSNQNATYQVYIDEVLLTSIPSGGSVEIYTDVALTSQVISTDVISSSTVNHYIIFVDNIGCKSQIESSRIVVSNSPSDPTPPSNQEFCSDTNPTVAELNPGTIDTYFWYENLDVSGDPIPPSLSPSDLLSNGTYYVQVDSFVCVSDPVAVIVSIDDPVNPGTSSTLEYCNDSLPVSNFDLFDELGGPKDTTGSWSGPLTTTNGHNGTVNISTLTTAGIYTFTYTVPSNGVCPDGVSTVTITVYETLSSGTPSAVNPASFCESGLPTDFDLFTLIENHDPDGQWTQGTSSTDPVVTSPIDLTTGAFTPGIYNFTYTQNISPNPCPEESTTVQIIVLQDPDAGNALNDEFCENDLASNSPYNLFDALDGSQDNNSGTWTDSSNNTISNSLDLTILTVTGSPYTYNYTIDNGVCSDTEPITITIEPAPESGTANTPVEFCEGTAPASFDLYSLIEGESGTGVWTNNTTSAIVPDPSNLDLSSYTDGTYDFTFDIDPIDSCDDVDVIVSIIINPLPNTGTPNNPPPFCENDPALSNTSFDLFSLLSGTVDSGGTWTDDSTNPISGALTVNTLDLSQLVVDTYNFTYSITDANDCTNSSTVAIIIEEAPESGTPVATFPDYCVGSAPASFDLYSLIDGESGTGVWTNNTISAIVPDPSNVDLSGYTDGTYDFTFDIDPIMSCDDVDVVVSIIINPLPNAGTADNQTFCENDPALSNTSFDLFSLLSGTVDSGGQWYTGVDNSGTTITNIIDLSVLGLGNNQYTYEVIDSSMCSNTTTVGILIEDAPESGIANAPVEFCLAEITTGQTYNLFDLLTDEDQTGTWNDDDASGALSGNTVTLDGLVTGTYDFTYDVDAIDSCDDVNVTVSIIINDTPAPTAVTPQEFCDTATVADLVATGTTIQWYDADTGGNLLTDTTVLVDAQIYYASQTDATTGCESSIRTAVTAFIYQTPNAGGPNATPIVACNDSTIDLTIGLDGTEDTGGTWYEGSDNSGTVIVDPTMYDVTALSANNYQFTYYIIASAPCVDASTTITVTIEEPLDAGTDGTPLNLCSNNGTVNLFDQLGGTPETGGSWNPTLTNSGIFDPLIDAPGTYTYTLENSCGTFSSDINVAVTLAPNAGSDNTAPICVIDGITDLSTFLSADAQSGGTWTFSGTGVTDQFNPSIDPAGVYTYTVFASGPCSTDSTAEITVIVNDTPTPTVTNNNPEFCLVDNSIVSDLESLVSSAGTINWYEDAALTFPLAGTEALVDGEDYYLTQTNSTGCESSSEQINVTINDTPTPTLDDPTLEYCINDNPTISTLSSNIAEHDSALGNLRWYDTLTGGSAYSESDLLTNITYYVALVDQVTGCESSIRLEVIPDLTACGKLEIPDGFSPNADGVNDTFDVDNLAILFPNFEMEIYNRNGNIVYKGNANSPRFDGTSNQSRVISKGNLPVGVYFYIFNFNDGENKPEQGRLYLSR